MSESFHFEWLEALKAMEAMDVDVLVPGHGKLGDKDSIRQFRDELASLMARIKEKMNQGLGREDVVKEVTYKDNVHVAYPPAFSERFSNYVKNSVRRIYDALAKRNSEV